VTDEKFEYDGLVGKYDHIVFSDRDNVPVMTPISGSSLFHEVTGTVTTKVFTNDKTLYRESFFFATTRVACASLVTRPPVL
jgi:hypothetical protein